MNIEYRVRAYVPTIKGCGAQDKGWDEERCKDFENFVNTEALAGWKLHSYEFRKVIGKNCGGGDGAWLVCVFERGKS